MNKEIIKNWVIIQDYGEVVIYIDNNTIYYINLTYRSLHQPSSSCPENKC